MVFKSLNLGPLQTPPLDPLVPNDSLFSELASIEETNEGFLKFELSLFHRIVVSKKDLKSPLVWWKTHES